MIEDHRILRGSKVVLRPLASGDLRRCVKWFSDPQVTQFLGRNTPVTLAEEERWFRDYVRRGDEQIFNRHTKVLAAIGDQADLRQRLFGEGAHGVGDAVFLFLIARTELSLQKGLELVELERLGFRLGCFRPFLRRLHLRHPLSLLASLLAYPVSMTACTRSARPSTGGARQARSPTTFSASRTRTLPDINNGSSSSRVCARAVFVSFKESLSSNLALARCE